MSNLKIVKKLTSIDPDMSGILERLYDLGLFEGQEIEILRTVSFGQITILKFDQTILALNQTEMSCLKF